VFHRIKVFIQSLKVYFFSLTTVPDNIDQKTLGILTLITESKHTTSKYYERYGNIYDLYLDSSNNITIEKNMDLGSSIAKKFFKFQDYYIVVSENQKTDFGHYYHNSLNDNEGGKEKTKDDPKECFILFEAIRASSRTVKDENIITKFLHDRFKLKIRIPYKYVMKINNDILNNKLNEYKGYVDDDDCAAELINSDGINKFFSNPKVKEFYGYKRSDSKKTIDEKEKGISSSLLVNHKGNSLCLESLNRDLSLFDDSVPPSTANLFEPKFKSIIVYFFGTRFNINSVKKYYFYFRDNKIVLYFKIANKDTGETDKYLCVVSFQEILNRENMIQIFSDIFKPKISTCDIESPQKKIRIFTYNKKWTDIECESRSYDTIYLPIVTKILVTSEMDKFLCFEKIYKEIGVPYKKGFLFYGPPGTGKTSLVKALAYKYDLSIYIIDVNSELVNNESIVTILNSISGSGNRIVLFEDIDTAFADKEELKFQNRENTIKDNILSKSDETLGWDATELRPNPKSIPQGETSTDEKITSKNTEKDVTKKTSSNGLTSIDSSRKFLTYSGLLNALDGVLTSQHGTIVIMTTNYKDKLGEALIRPGRIDFSLELTYCDRHQIIEMTKNMISKSYNIINKILTNKEDPVTSDHMSKFVFYNPYNIELLSKKIETFTDNLMENQTTSKIKPCELQVYILKYLENVDNIFERYHELLDKK
jgi:hypothetical protein